MSMNYEHDRKLLRSGDVADENLHFSSSCRATEMATVFQDLVMEENHRIRPAQPDRGQIDG
jgi:hypothetical protein